MLIPVLRARVTGKGMNLDDVEDLQGRGRLSREYTALLDPPGVGPAPAPVIAAVGGMAVPALVYLAIAGASGEAGRGWGIPMATDIAFAIGILFGRLPRLPADVVHKLEGTALAVFSPIFG